MSNQTTSSSTKVWKRQKHSSSRLLYILLYTVHTILASTNTLSLWNGRFFFRTEESNNRRRDSPLSHRINDLWDTKPAKTGCNKCVSHTGNLRAAAAARYGARSILPWRPSHTQYPVTYYPSLSLFRKTSHTHTHTRSGLTMIWERLYSMQKLTKFYFPSWRGCLQQCDEQQMLHWHPLKELSLIVQVCMCYCALAWPFSLLSKRSLSARWLLADDGTTLCVRERGSADCTCWRCATNRWASLREWISWLVCSRDA